MVTLVAHGERVRIPFGFKGKVVSTPVVSTTSGEVILINTDANQYEAIFTPSGSVTATVSAMAQVDLGDGRGPFEYVVSLGDFTAQPTTDAVTIVVGDPVVEKRPGFKQLSDIKK